MIATITIFQQCQKFPHRASQIIAVSEALSRLLSTPPILVAVCFVQFYFLVDILKSRLQRDIAGNCILSRLE